MKLEKTKTKTVTLIMVLAFATAILSLPMASAHDPAWEIPVFTYAAVRPNPIGVGQEALILFWPNFVPPTATGPYGDRYTWTVEVTTPSGTKENLGPFKSDPIGGGWAIYTPSQLGTYTFVAKLADHVITGLPENPDTGISSPQYVGDTMLGSSSNPVTLTVQQDPIEAWQENPLPEEYWTRPINDANRDWYMLAGNWLGGAAQQNGPTSSFGYGLAPESAHIMWTRPYYSGGIMDERFGNIGYQTAHYDGLSFDPPIIINGKIYYNIDAQPKYGWNCLDLYTGELEFFHNTTGDVIVGSSGTGLGVVSSGALRTDSSGAILGGWLEFGQILNYESPNQHGGYAYLIGRGPNGETNIWQIFDAFTGNYICSVANVSSSGTQVYSKDGSILYYNINNGRLTCWNSTHAIESGYTQMRNYEWCWRTFLNNTFDGNNGFSLDIPIPTLEGRILAVRDGESIIGGTGGQNDPNAVEQGTLWALSLEPGKEGTLLWSIDFTPPRASTTAALNMRGGYPVSGPTIVPEYNVFLFEEANTLRRWAYDLTTGQQLWESDPEPQLNYYGMSDNVYDGKLLSCGYAGTLIAYDIRTGTELWKYDASNVGFESPYGNYPIGIVFIADGKIYLTSSEHSPTQPLWRGPNLRCIDAETGEELWKALFWGAGMGSGTGAVIADGYIVGLSFYDNQIYCFGKGPSQTTVTAAPKITAWGDSILLEGTVLDIAAGTNQQEQAARFPNGVPAVSDASQEGWMEYVYMQQSCPAYVEGVEVKLETLDPNNNFYEIGRATSDASGFYSLDWEPPVPGKYTIYATFEGTKSYYRSFSETAILVSESTSAAQSFEPEFAESTAISSGVPTHVEAPLVTSEIAIIAVVAVASIIGIVAFVAIRKRK
jgi:hypothetical protein